MRIKLQICRLIRTFPPPASSSQFCPPSLPLSQTICCVQSSSIDLQLCAGDHMLIYSVSDKHSSALPHICPTDSLSFFSQHNWCHPPSFSLSLSLSVYKWPSSFWMGVHLSGCKLFLLLLLPLLVSSVQCVLVLHGSHVCC